MAQRKSDKLTFDKVENMIEESVLSLDEESECSEDEDFESIASNLPLSSEISEESSDEPHTETANRTSRKAHIGDRIPLLQVGPQGIILCMNSQAQNALR